MPERRLKDLRDVRRYLANLINRTERKEVDAVLAGRLGYLASILTRVMEGSELEQRVEVLEKKLNREK
ncbi:conserved hypothetical protein [uncultured Desulfobacterium sp.]|uniref:Uncharacterized protein n=1 Tax=uncultured Desulfobacterium sp. TaxID=201089 RepID=A0A445MWB8_9BACT|nr:conserved hypothetical protein [uncultured Desulfobacterium sp.]